MEVRVKLAPFVVYKDCVCCFWGVYFRKFNQSVLKSLFRAILAEKGCILKNLTQISARKIKSK